MKLKKYKFLNSKRILKQLKFLNLNYLIQSRCQNYYGVYFKNNESRTNIDLFYSVNTLNTLKFHLTTEALSVEKMVEVLNRTSYSDSIRYECFGQAQNSIGCLNCKCFKINFVSEFEVAKVYLIFHDASKHNDVKF